MKHCCDMMRANVEKACDQHPDPFECTDHLVHFWPKSGDYGLIIHDGGRSCVTINFCPWCGAELPVGEG